MNALTKRTVVMQVSDVTKILPPGTVPFDTRQGAEPDEAIEEYFMQIDVWEELGRPEQISLTVEPGDMLNDR